MSPIEELSQETNDSMQMAIYGSSSNYVSSFGVVTDNTSVQSNNSRNFQMPEKDLISEISKQRNI